MFSHMFSIFFPMLFPVFCLVLPGVSRRILGPGGRPRDGRSRSGGGGTWASGEIP